MTTCLHGHLVSWSLLHLFRFSPSEPVPNRLQRPLAMAFQPPGAENSLQYSQRNADQEAIACPGVFVQSKTETVIEDRPSNRLHHVIAEAHLAKRDKDSEYFATYALAEKQDKTCDEDKGESYVVP